MIKLSDVKVRPQYRTRVRYRLVVLEYAWEHGPAAPGRHYGLSARTIRRWRKRWRRGVSRGWCRQRVHGIRLAMGTIQRVFRDMGLPRLRRTLKREPRQMKLFEKAEPGESIQVDVKYVQIAGRWAFQYTAPGRLHPLPSPAALSAFTSPVEPRLPDRAPAGLSVPHPAPAV